MPDEKSTVARHTPGSASGVGSIPKTGPIHDTKIAVFPVNRNIFMGFIPLILF
jgi:hypothetical protein